MKGAVIMLEKKINQSIELLNQTLSEEGISVSDMGKDAIRSAKGFTLFENSFDNIIKMGKKDSMKRKSQR